MTDARTTGGDNNDDLLAGEYVLGVLPHAERDVFARRLAGDPRLAAHVRLWEERFARLSDAVQPVAPPARLRNELERRLFPSEPVQAGVWQSLFFWRSLTAASLAALALLAVLYVSIPSILQKTQANYVAELSGATDVVRLVAFYDAGAGILKVNRVAGAPAAGRDFELWLIEGNNEPVSLGVLPQQASGMISLPRQIVAKLDGAVLAISDEPKSGSPTGQPTGAVLATGKLNSI